MRNELIAERRSLDCINRTSHRSQSSFSTLLFLMTVLIFNCCLVSVEGQGNSNPVFDGVQRDDEIAIRDAIQKDPSSIDTKGVGGQTPLIHAVLTGKLTAVKTLIDLGADMTATEKDGYNILHAAGFQGRDAILQYLLSSDKVKSAGLDPKADQHSDGYYPLHRACWGREVRHTKTVEVFLDYGVPADLKSRDGRHCLDMTRNQGTVDVITSRMNGAEL